MARNLTFKRHANLFLTMAERQGLDLEEEVLRAHLTPDEIVDGVLRCTGCTCADACEQTLAAGGHKGSVPELCRNATLLRDLADKD